MNPAEMQPKWTPGARIPAETTWKLTFVERSKHLTAA